MVTPGEHYYLFPEMSDGSRIWIFQSVEPFNLSDLALLDQIIRPFLAQWKAHQKQVNARAEILLNHFLIIVADESQIQVSGCAGDALHHIIQELAIRMGKDLLDRLLLPVLMGDGLVFYTRRSLMKKMEEGNLAASTLLLDPTVRTLGEWKEHWMVPLKNSWVAKPLSKSITASN